MLLDIQQQQQQQQMVDSIDKKIQLNLKKALAETF